MLCCVVLWLIFRGSVFGRMCVILSVAGFLRCFCCALGGLGFRVFMCVAMVIFWVYLLGPKTFLVLVSVYCSWLIYCLGLLGFGVWCCVLLYGCWSGWGCNLGPVYIWFFWVFLFCGLVFGFVLLCCFWVTVFTPFV